MDRSNPTAQPTCPDRASEASPGLPSRSFSRRACLTLALAAGVGLAGPAQAGGPHATPPTSAAAEVVPDRILVKFKRGQSSAHVDGALSRARVNKRKSFRASGVSLLEVRGRGRSVHDVVQELEDSGVVEYAHPDHVVHADTVPSDPLFPQLWGLHNPADTDIDAPEAWDITMGSHQVVVGVIDSGVDYTHPDLAANMWQNPGEVMNGVDDDGNGYVDDVYGIDAITGSGDPDDDYGHGTHVAGTIGARANDGFGIVGVSPNVQIMALKFLDDNGDGYTSDAIEALEYAIEMNTEYGVNVKLTSNSWGGGGYSPSLRDAIAASGDAGMLFVAAAGNDSENCDDFPHYPSSYAEANVVSVAATDSDDELASFSNYGAVCADLAAPGVGIWSAVPGGSHEAWNGTSMATPHVAGAAALIWAERPNADPLDVKDLLLGTVDLVPDLSGITVTGGRLNVHSALLGEPQPRIQYVAASGPIEGWIDATIGPEVGISADDQSVEIPIGFEFDFYGQSFDSLFVSSNGFLSFAAEGASAYQNAPIPSLNAPNGVIAPYWVDFNPATGGSIHSVVQGQAPNRTLTVEWNDVRYYGESETATFQVTLYETSNEIRFRYLEVAPFFGSTATVGIEDPAGGNGLQVSYEQPNLANETMIVIVKRSSCGLLGIEIGLVLPFAGLRRLRHRGSQARGRAS